MFLSSNPHNDGMERLPQYNFIVMLANELNCKKIMYLNILVEGYKQKFTKLELKKKTQKINCER